ncbi:alpha-amylase family glycosyl hydrolase [Neobacillus sp. NPDC093127]|uniref:alpha-amylase family glycosyl hydrolase n=1 Tax=Neobacillus sp. NPDC093127 TaxID=3364296 RepID=UPI003807360C
MFSTNRENKNYFRKFFAFLISLIMTFQCAIFTGIVYAEDNASVTQTKNDETKTIKGVKKTKNGLTMTFNPTTGDLISVSYGNKSLDFRGALWDVGMIDFLSGQEDWHYARERLWVDDADRLHTYELPNVWYRNGSKDPTKATFTDTKNGVDIKTTINNLEMVTHYVVNNKKTVETSVTIKNVSNGEIKIDGVAYLVQNMALQSNAEFEYPGNLPQEVYATAGLPPEYSINTSYSSPQIHINNNNQHINLLFVDTSEKWISSMTKEKDQSMTAINLATTLQKLAPNQSLEVGTQYIQLVGKDNPYKAAQDLYTSKGWTAPTDGVKGEPVYSGHPSGTSDDNFETPHKIDNVQDGSKPGTLQYYAHDLQKIKNMGFTNMWLLPIFDHPNSNGSIYLPYNMENIDSRYGGTEGAKAYASTAASLGVNLMYDYVPHGPYMYTRDDSKPVTDNTPLYDNPWMTEEHQAWASKDIYGNYRSEWNCYAFDFANPNYLQYMKELAYTQAKNFGVSGARIDANMGSIPNWNPYGSNRPSETGLFGGSAMTKAIRDGIKAAGKTPIILPENNNPVPFYAPATDLFYDMPFYQVTKNLRDNNVSEQDFAVAIAHWLDTEQQSSPKGLQHGRFLENHDTVAPWYSNFDQQRAVEVYGADKARAMWVLLSTIDGAPIIYQNDENGNEDFFTTLLSMRKQNLGANYDIQYYKDENSGVVAFRRFIGDAQKLVLVNLTNKTAARDFSNIDIGGIKFSTAKQKKVYGDAQISGDKITLAPYQSVVIELTGGKSLRSSNTPKGYKVRNILDEYKAAADAYLPPTFNKPTFKVPSVAPGNKVFNPYLDFSTKTADGDMWKYMYLLEGKKDLQFCTVIDDPAVVGVWRASGTNSGNYNWIGAGVNTNVVADNFINQPFELDSNGNDYGMLVFSAAEDGKYTIPAFSVYDSDGNSTGSMLVILKNGEYVYHSDILFNKADVPSQVFDLKKGDNLMFYTVKPMGGYSYIQLSGLTINYTP